MPAAQFAHQHARRSVVAFAVILLATTVASATRAPAKATRVVSNEGGFSVDMPCADAKTTPTPNFTGGFQVDCEGNGFVALASSRPIIVTDAPEGELDFNARLVLESAGGSLSSVASTPCGRYPGREFKLTRVQESRVLLVRLCLAEEKNRLFTFMVSSNDSAVVDARARTLIGSFAVLDVPRADIRGVDVIKRVATTMNRSMPMMLDSETEILSTTGLAGMFAIHYRAVNLAIADLDPPKFAAAMRPVLVRDICGNVRLRDGLLRQGVRLRAIYVDKELRQIAIIDMTAADCGAAPAARAA